MIDVTRVAATLPAADLDRARRWYEEKLGLTPTRETPGGLDYEWGSGQFMLYPSQFAGSAQNTALGVDVDDIEAAVVELAGRGVVFEQYDLPGLKTDERGIAEIAGERAAWFKDSEGNILCIDQEESTG